MRRRHLPGASAVFLGVLGGSLAGVGVVPASASVDPGVWWNGAYEGYCLDGGAAGQAFLAPCDDEAHQQWTSPTLAGEPGAVGAVFAMRNQQTDQCLTGDAQGRVFTTTCTYDDAQGWIGGSLLVNRATGLCVAAEKPADLKQVPCDPDYLSDDQRWYPAQAGT